MTNEVLVQQRIGLTGKVVCYPGTTEPCVNVFLLILLSILVENQRGLND